VRKPGKAGRATPKRHRKANDLGTLPKWFPYFVREMETLVEEIVDLDEVTSEDLAAAMIGRAGAELLAKGYSRTQAISFLRQAVQHTCDAGMNGAVMGGFVPPAGSA